MSGRVINVSPSLLSDVLTCETRAWVKHTKGYTSPSDSIKAKAGQAIHAGIANYLDPRGVALPTPADEALRIFHRVYDDAFAALPAEQLEPSLTPANLHRVLARWLEMNPPSRLPWTRVLTVEEAFCSREWTFGDTRVRLICRPDAIVQDAHGAIRWMDTKTTGWNIADSGWQKALRLSLQAQLYTDAVAQRYGAQGVLGGWFNAIELKKLPSGPQKCRDHGLPKDSCGKEHAKDLCIEALTTEEHVERALLTAHRAAETFVGLMRDDVLVQALDVQGTANGACRFCPANDWCESGRVPAALEHMLKYDPWIVEEGTRE